MAQRKGYAGKMLRVDLSSGAISTMPTEVYTERYLGGRGIAAGVHWDEVPPEIGAFDPQIDKMFNSFGLSQTEGRGHFGHAVI